MDPPIRFAQLFWRHGGYCASADEATHINVDKANKLVADWKASGATRTHSCSCLGAHDAMVAHLEWVSALSTPFLLPQLNGLQSTNQGWADTFERLALRLGLATTSPTGARLFTGHSARATGATHLAHTQIKLKLWRIQLFGRWGSDCFKRCIRDGPLRQLHGLAQEASLRTSFAAARAELMALLSSLGGIPSSPSGALRTQSAACLADCEAAELITEPSVAPWQSPQGRAEGSHPSPLPVAHPLFLVLCKASGGL